MLIQSLKLTLNKVITEATHITPRKQTSKSIWTATRRQHSRMQTDKSTRVHLTGRQSDARHRLQTFLGCSSDRLSRQDHKAHRARGCWQLVFGCRSVAVGGDDFRQRKGLLMLLNGGDRAEPSHILLPRKLDALKKQVSGHLPVRESYASQTPVTSKEASFSAQTTQKQDQTTTSTWIFRYDPSS